MADTVGLKNTIREVDTLSRDLEKDLEAVFNLLQGDIILLLDEAAKEGWTPERLILEVEALI